MTDHTVSTLAAATALDGTELFYGVQGGADTKVTSAQIKTYAGARTTLTTNTDYYISHDTGSDSNAGSVGAPWLTMQHAVNFIAQTLDIAGFRITLHVADSASTYAGAAWNSFTGGGAIVFLGNNTTLGNVKVGNAVDNNGFTVGSFISEGGNSGTQIWISGFQMAPSAGPCLDCDGADRGFILLGEPTFLVSTKNKYSGCQASSYVIIGNVFDLTLDVSVIDGAALTAKTPAGFIYQINIGPQGSYLYLPDFTVTGTVTFSRAFAVAAADRIQLTGTIGGFANVSGKKFEVVTGGTLSTDSLTSLPGTLPGTNAGNLVVGSDNYLGTIPLTKSLQTPSTGFSITISNNVGALLLKPAGTLATGTITMPANPIDQQRLVIVSSKQVTALTVSPNSGQSVLGNPTAIAAGTAINAIYNYSDTTWYISSSPASGGGSGMAIGDPVTSGTTGSVLFVGAGPVLAQNNTNFFWDDTNLRMKIGSTGTPTGEYWINGVRALFGVPNVSGNNWFEAGAGNTTLSGYLNFGTGDGCMASLTTGYNNAAMGALALNAATSAFNNIAIGSEAMWFGQLDSLNVAIGGLSLASLGAGGAGSGNNVNNVALGFGAFSNASQGNGNIALGANSLNTISGTANQNTVIGNGAANALGTAAGGTISNNTLIGSNSAKLMQNASNGNTWVGRYQGSATPTYNDTIAFSDGNGTTAELLDYGITSHALSAGFSAWSISYDFHWSQPAVLHLYNVQDSLGVATNYERGVLDWFGSTNVFTIGTQKGGTGSTRNMRFVIGGTDKLNYGITNAATWTSPAAICVTPVLVAALPTAGIMGRRHFVSDATVTTFASVVAGTGGNPVPVYDDGTNWRIG